MCALARPWSRRVVGAVLLAVPLRVSAQTCDNSRSARLTFGVGQFHCQGGSCRAYGAIAVSRNDTWGRGGSQTRFVPNGPQRLSFSVEPSLWRIDPDGPAGGKAADGDVLVAVNGYSVTSERGTDELNAMEAGVPITLLLRRGERLFEVHITPGWTCDGLTVSAGSSPTPPNWTGSFPRELRGSRVWDVDTIQVDSLVIDSFLVGTGTDTLLTDTLALFPRTDLLWPAGRARGTLGIGISCSRCILQYTQGRTGASWEFAEYPEVISVTAGGSADRAGLQAGDVLTHVDGLDITSADGGARFGSLEPGETIEIRYRRGDRSRTATLTVDPGL